MRLSGPCRAQRVDHEAVRRPASWRPPRLLTRAGDLARAAAIAAAPTSPDGSSGRAVRLGGCLRACVDLAGLCGPLRESAISRAQAPSRTMSAVANVWKRRG